MNQEMILRLAKDALQITLTLSGPLLLISLIVGVLISIAQVVTSIQDMTLSFVPRIIALFVSFLFFFPWMMKVMTAFTMNLLGHLETFAR